MQIKYLNWLLFVVFAIGIIGASLLVLDEFKTSNVCPRLMGIPACYIILFCFIIPFIIHILKGKKLLYFLFTSLAFSIAAIASIMQFMGLGECPKTAHGVPMCYYSLVLFTLLIVLKIIINKKSIDTGKTV